MIRTRLTSNLKSIMRILYAKGLKATIELAKDECGDLEYVITPLTEDAELLIEVEKIINTVIV